MKIIEMTADHVAHVAELEKLCFSDPWSEKSIASELTNKLALWLVAEEDGRVTGYIGSQTVPDESDMMNVAVHPDFRRRGIAEALVMALCAALKEQGSVSLTLEVRASNDPAKALYEKLGFEQVGRRPNYYRNPKEDALIFRKML
jgi:ribosomal-protein-alanine N-acetyltransferase